MDLTRAFTSFANEVSRLAGRAWTFVICILLVLAWALTGPAFNFSDTWQLVINTSTTIITFLMVFLIQNTQNRDNAALQAKLDELIRVTNAKNGYIGIEKLTDKELEGILQDFESEATPLGLKSRIIEKKAAEARNRKTVEAVKKAEKPAQRRSKAPVRRKAS
jgi:low affinity Fe/Cu permease